MKVKKRDGTMVNVRLDEITDRIASFATDLDPIVDPVKITLEVVEKIQDGISTSVLDSFTADICYARSAEHPHFTILASRLIVSDHQKTVSIASNMKFSEVCKLLMSNTDQLNESSSLISDELFNISQEHANLIDTMIDDSRDFLIDYFGFKTLYKSYLLRVGDKVVETPQHMFMRVAIGIHGSNFDLVKETYDLMSNKYFTHATPTLFNSGTKNPQFFSCFLLQISDNIQSIFKVLSDTAQISKWSGGIGLHITGIRSNGSYIRGTGGKSDGIVPMLKVYNDTARYINQCFAKETLIPTTNGIKRFDEIIVGDEVITGKGTTERVAKVFRTSNLDDSKLIGITIKHSIEPVWVTGAHPMFCIKDQAKSLNYSLILNRLEKSIIEPDFVEVKDLRVDDMIGFAIPSYEKDIPEYSNEDCRFYGIMIGDGHVSKDGDQSYICGNPLNNDFEFYSNYLYKAGCKVNKEPAAPESETTDRNSKYRRLVFTPQISQFKFGRVHLYDNNDEKQIHSSFLHLPIGKALQIVHGVLETDGHIGKDEKGTEIVLEMTSKNVIDSIKYILLRAGVLTSGAIVDRVGESHDTENGTITAKKIAYRLRIPKVQIICDLLGLTFSSDKITQFVYKNYIFSRIKRIESKIYKGAVYDLETNGPEHTYLTPLGIAHNGGGKRSGSFAMYIEPWHADIQDFLKCKLPHGDEVRRARDLFYALWIPDLFMERVKNNKMWSLMCPSECPGLNEVYGSEFKKLYETYEKQGKIVKTVKAQDLFHEIVSSQIETGTPYMLYKDAANQKSNQKNIGTIKSSNLCVAPETRILTSNGWFPISSLNNQTINVWNGTEWSETTVKQTGANQKLIKVTLSNGTTLHCTEYHKFYINAYCNYSEEGDEISKQSTVVIEAQFLQKGLVLKNHNLPIIHDGPELEFIDENIVPINYSLDSKLRWFGQVLEKQLQTAVCSNDIIDFIEVGNTNSEYLRDIQLMLQSIDIHSTVTDTPCYLLSNNPPFKLFITFADTQKLLYLGLQSTKIKKTTPAHLALRLQKQSVKNSMRSVYVMDVSDEGRTDDTYCFTEPLKGMGIFEGVLTGNCAEIIEYSDDNKHACCVLASIVLPTYVVEKESGPEFDHKKLFDVVRVVTRNLNRVIDINFYPVKETKTSNMSERPLGIGVQGLADVFYKLKIAYDSEKALVVDKDIFETIYYAALTESMELAKIHGTYATYKGSPISQGLFQFDLWKKYQKIEVVHSGRWDWELLRKNIMEHGVRNSLVTALMPTASTSQIMGSASEAFEPVTSNCYTRRTKAGEFTVLNRYMANTLIENGLWDEKMKNNLLHTRGSIQNITHIPKNIKEIYKTVWELKQKVLIDHSAARGIYVDQSQSLNLYFEDANYDQITKAHFYGWQKGLKTGSYYIRSKPAINSASFTTEEQQPAAEEEDTENCEACGS